MKLSAEIAVAAPRERVFAALVDPAVLQRCIPGCEEWTDAGGPGIDAYRVRLKMGIAGLNGSYTGTAALRDRQPPESFTLAFDGKGGPGFVRGTAAVRLIADAGATRVVCDADVHVGGLIAAVGSRLIDAAARKLTDDFFRQLSAEIDRLRDASGH